MSAVSLPNQDPISFLPLELNIEIFSQLPPRELSIYAGVSKTWQQFLLSNVFWKETCQKYGIKGNANISWKQRCKEAFACDGKRRKKVLDFFAEQPKIYPCGVWLRPSSMNHVTTFSFQKGGLIVGYSDGHLMALRNKDTLQDVLAHDGPIHHLQIQDETLFTSSEDKTIKMWDPQNLTLKATFSMGEPVHTFYYHNTSHTLVGASEKKIAIWNVQTIQIETILASDVEIDQVQCNDRYIVVTTIAEPSCIELIDQRTKKHLDPLIFNNVCGLQLLSENHLVVSDKQNQMAQLILIDLENRKTLFTCNTQTELTHFQFDERDRHFLASTPGGNKGSWLQGYDSFTLNPLGSWKMPPPYRGEYAHFDYELNGGICFCHSQSLFYFAPMMSFNYLKRKRE